VTTGTEPIGPIDQLGRFVREVVRPAIHGRRHPLKVAAHHLHGEPIPAIEALGGYSSRSKSVRRWGGRWDTTWFRYDGFDPR
jgi:alpha-mannosidase